MFQLQKVQINWFCFQNERNNPLNSPAPILAPSSFQYGCLNLVKYAMDPKFVYKSSQKINVKYPLKKECQNFGIICIKINNNFLKKKCDTRHLYQVNSITSATYILPHFSCNKIFIHFLKTDLTWRSKSESQKAVICSQNQ